MRRYRELQVLEKTVNSIIRGRLHTTSVRGANPGGSSALWRGILDAVFNR